MANEANVNVDLFMRKLNIEIGIDSGADAVKVLKEIGTATGLPIKMDVTGIGMAVFQLLRETGVEVEGIAYNQIAMERGVEN